MADTPKKTLGLETAEPAVTPSPADVESTIKKKPVSPGASRKREIPQGLWTKCPECGDWLHDDDYAEGSGFCKCDTDEPEDL